MFTVPLQWGPSEMSTNIPWYGWRPHFSPHPKIQTTFTASLLEKGAHYVGGQIPLSHTGVSACVVLTDTTTACFLLASVFRPLVSPFSLVVSMIGVFTHWQGGFGCIFRLSAMHSHLLCCDWTTRAAVLDFPLFWS